MTWLGDGGGGGGERKREMSDRLDVGSMSTRFKNAGLQKI